MQEENAGLVRSSEEQITVITRPETPPEIVEIVTRQKSKVMPLLLFSYLPWPLLP